MLKLINIVLFGLLINISIHAQAPNDKTINIIPVVTVAPNYPLNEAINKVEGYVELMFTVTEEGNVENPKVLTSHPEGVFDREVIKAILKYKFVPSIVNGQAVKQETTQRIEFKLHSTQEQVSGITLARIFHQNGKKIDFIYEKHLVRWIS